MTQPPATPGINRPAAITRSLLGWGVVAGPFYLAFGLILALTYAEFDPTRDALSLLLRSDLGWLQWLNLVLSALMVIAAAAGLRRTPGWPPAAAVLVAAYGLCLVLSAVFPPDPTDTFPPGTATTDVSTVGVLHLIFGGLGFLSIAIAAIIAGSWLGARHRRGAFWSRLAGVAIIITFLAGGALSQGRSGVALIWITVLVTWAWLALVSIAAYRAVPHPDDVALPAPPDPEPGSGTARS